MKQMKIDRFDDIGIIHVQSKPGRGMIAQPALLGYSFRKFFDGGGAIEANHLKSTCAQ